MYIPKHYLAEDQAEIVDFIKTYSFATIVTNIEGIPVATHLPFHISERDNQVILSSHFSRANSQWKHIEQDNILVIFSEPHAYISPTHYESQLSVPTWNYVAVHIYGQGKIMGEASQTLNILENTIAFFEPAYKEQWDILPEDYKTKMMKGIVAFEIEVTDIQAKKKLSQNKTEKEQQNIIEALSKSSNATEKAIADLMQKNMS